MDVLFTVRLGTLSSAVRVTERSRLAVVDAPASLIVADEHTAAYLPEGSPRVILASGESAKRWASVEAILSAALDAGLGRDGVFIGVGGGVICDVTAFAASIYQRGVGVILVPTTLLAMVDAALGGKTGINYGGYKNMVGTFHPASEVRIDVSVLSTLPDREFASGLAEVIKSGMLGDEDLLSLLESQRDAVLERRYDLMLEVVSRSLAVKKRFVEEDFTEQGVRAHLNLGHTFGHGLESASKFDSFTHGEAVVWGMARALDAGVDLGRTDEAYRDRCLALFRDYGYRLTATGIDLEVLVDAMSRDKKKKGGAVRFVLQEQLGETFLSPLDPALVRRVVARGLADGGS